ncbi:hypothetical protein [Desulfosediminicola flagellatus]|uniref:hypothetical protein n=1 Tax=Desulfosediminicola flagellatus TaxID=2569541 RepID=UPI0010AC4475|nr:hypothetical protein [Desulfosediminicola flagellatus]
MKIRKTITKTLIVLGTIMMFTTPVLAGDNGSGRGGRYDCDRNNGNSGDDGISVILDQDTSILLARRGNDCDHTHDHDHDNDKAGNGNRNGQDDDTSNSATG